MECRLFRIVCICKASRLLGHCMLVVTDLMYQGCQFALVVDIQKPSKYNLKIIFHWIDVGILVVKASAKYCQFSYFSEAEKRYTVVS